MNKENKNSKSKIAANNRYVENTYDRFTFRVKRNESPTKSEIKNSAKNENMSVNSFIIALFTKPSKAIYFNHLSNNFTKLYNIFIK